MTKYNRLDWDVQTGNLATLAIPPAMRGMNVLYEITESPVLFQRRRRA